MALVRRLESTRFPYLPVHISVGRRSVQVEALVDTGFDGHVALPAHLLADSEQPDLYVTWALADGSEVLAPAFVGTVHLGDFDPFSVLVTTIGDEPLVGRGVTDRFAITLDHGQKIVVEP